MALFDALKATERSLVFAAVRVAVGVGARVAPQKTAQVVARRFFRTERPPADRLQWRDELPVVDTVRVADGSLTTYRWGEPARPTVLLMHGWSGWAQQMQSFVAPLRARGLTVLAIDHVAHGASDGDRTSLPSMIAALEQLLAEMPQIGGAIAHSLGAAALTAALSNTRRALAGAVLIAPPADARPYLRQLMAMIGLPKRLWPDVEQAAVAITGVPFERLVVQPWRLKRLQTPLLVVHDLQDREVPLADGYAYTTTGARMLVTDGLGHNRILRDRHVVEVATAFVTRKEDIARPQVALQIAA